MRILPWSAFCRCVCSCARNCNLARLAHPFAGTLILDSCSVLLQQGLSRTGGAFPDAKLPGSPALLRAGGVGLRNGGREGAASPGPVPISLNLDGCICTSPCLSLLLSL